MIVLDASAAVDCLLNRYPHGLRLSQIWQLRHNFSAYDAAYLVLAENLGDPLIACDSNLASAAAQIATVELF
jgi:predicted nucleic acid-binding protein